jgi:hypothetical protein
MKKLIVIADMGRVRALTVKEGSEPEGIPDRLTEHAAGSLDVEMETRSGTVTDQSGRFAQNAGAGVAGGMSHGEGHQLDNELQRKNMERIAAHITKVVEESGCPPTVLAAPQSVLQRLESSLSTRAQNVIVNRVGADLTKEPVAKLQKRFL